MRAGRFSPVRGVPDGPGGHGTARTSRVFEGIALAHVDQKSGDRTEWIFDPKTYAYLGSRAVQVKQADGIKPGTVINWTAVLERAVVDAQRQRPGAQGTAT
ncbi:MULTISPECIES: hypothetical protein [Streptomyces]|uniref:Uncharacterized protein n=1 Tax=Streptomyces canarius TaxID=285453 RepID=A0ABQ3D584_9ACTN|nr:hypothetical protein [Streptomyces canarius]GHA59351.1 hypothetical protein GCM10010345_74590 [Streptomyces canarius]